MLYFKKISKNKCVEVSSRGNWKNSYIALDFCINKNQSHAGFHFLVSVFRWVFEFNIYDIRHWDYRNNCWEVYIESKAVDKKEIEDNWEDQMGIGV